MNEKDEPEYLEQRPVRYGKNFDSLDLDRRK